MTGSINIFVPIYNEADSLAKIEMNIRRARKVFPDVGFYFSDNASDDGTHEMLHRLRGQYPDNVRISACPENVGFQRNLATITSVPDDRMILILGANDQLYTPGLRKLREIVTEEEHDLVVCSCCYVTGDDKLRLLHIVDKDVPTFSASSLDEYFQQGGRIPNGIMQYVIHPRHSRLFSKYVNMVSPQVGAFFDIFPAKVHYISYPPLALVNKIEHRGWRSTVEGILEMHLFLAKDIIVLAWNAYKARRLSLLNFLRIRIIYTHSLMYLMFKELAEKKFWGSWQSRGLKKLMYVIRYCLDVFWLSPLRWMNIPCIVLVAVNAIKYRIFLLFRKEQHDSIRQSRSLSQYP